MAGGSEGFVPLVGIPGLDKEPDFNSYVNALYALAISVAALIAVIQIVIGGAQYMMDDLITHKSAAKERIKNALIGLLIIIAAALILTTINSDLTHLNINAPQINLDNTKPTTTPWSQCEEGISCVILYCEGWIFDGMEIKEGETDVDACRRVCQEDYFGEFSAHTVSPKSSTCKYDPVIASSCNPQNSWNCCEDVNSYEWDSAHQRCNTANEPYVKIFCGSDFKTCEDTMAACRESGNEVISKYIPNSNDPADISEGSSILCTDNEQQQINQQIETQKQDCIKNGYVWMEAISSCDIPSDQPTPNYY